MKGFGFEMHLMTTFRMTVEDFNEKQLVSLFNVTVQEIGKHLAVLVGKLMDRDVNVCEQCLLHRCLCEHIQFKASSIKQAALLHIRFITTPWCGLLSYNNTPHPLLLLVEKVVPEPPAWSSHCVLDCILQYCLKLHVSGKSVHFLLMMQLDHIKNNIFHLSFLFAA